MTPEQFEIIQKAAGLIVAIIGLIGLVPAVNWLKTKLNIDGGKAQILAAAVSVIVALVSLIASGDLNPETVVSEQFLAILLLVWTVSQQIYKRLMAQEEGNKQLTKEQAEHLVNVERVR